MLCVSPNLIIGERRELCTRDEDQAQFLNPILTAVLLFHNDSIQLFTHFNNPLDDKNILNPPGYFTRWNDKART